MLRKVNLIMKSKITAVLVEDESLARDLLKNFLKDYAKVKIIGEYADGFSGIQAINRDKPELIFLDIKIPKISGIELMELIDYQPEVIFTTAFDEYAVKAFDMNAVDYLMKPFSRERFKVAIERAIDRIEHGEPGEKPEFISLKETPDEYIERIVVRSRGNIYIIQVIDVIYLEAQDDYVMIYTNENRHLKQKTLKFYEDHLDPKEFVRVHRSYIVRVDQISRLEQYEKESFKIILTNQIKVSVSKSGYKKLKEILKF